LGRTRCRIFRRAGIQACRVDRVGIRQAEQKSAGLRAGIEIGGRQGEFGQRERVGRIGLFDRDGAAARPLVARGRAGKVTAQTKPSRSTTAPRILLSSPPFDGPPDGLTAAFIAWVSLAWSTAQCGRGNYRARRGNAYDDEAGGSDGGQIFLSGHE